MHPHARVFRCGQGLSCNVLKDTKKTSEQNYKVDYSHLLPILFTLAPPISLIFILIRRTHHSFLPCNQSLKSKDMKSLCEKLGLKPAKFTITEMKPALEAYYQAHGNTDEAVKLTAESDGAGDDGTDDDSSTFSEVKGGSDNESKDSEKSKKTKSKEIPDGGVPVPVPVPALPVAVSVRGGPG